MVYAFRFNIILRAAILLALVAGLVLTFQWGYFLASLFLAALLIFSVLDLIRYVNQTNRDLAHFFAAIQYDDFTTSSGATHKGRSFGELHQQFRLITRKFQEVRAEKEANHQFLQAIVEHIDVGLLGVGDKGEILLMNRALQGMLHRSYLIDLEGLRRVDEHLFEVVSRLRAGQRELVRLNHPNHTLQLAVQAAELKLQGEPFRLLSFTNIRSELEAQELVAWQKLIRILTHEIMNSVAPIASLSSTVRDVLAEQRARQPDGDGLDPVRRSLEVIQRRSEGLLQFTEAYRSLTRLPPPNIQPIEARELIDGVLTLFGPQLKAAGIDFQVHLPPGDLTFQGDPALLEQVLINLLKNAIDAVENTRNPQIELRIKPRGNGKTILQVADNGPGIPPGQLDQIFVPFYTTKEAGSGIGLSLSRQIMRLHQGNIEVHSTVGEGTLVRLAL